MTQLVVCEENLEVMLKKDQQLIHMVAGKYQIDGFSHEDLFQECSVKYMEVVRNNSYKASKGMFSTYIVKCLHSWLKTLHKRHTKKLSCIKLVTGISARSLASEHDDLGIGMSAAHIKLNSQKEYDFDEKIYFEELFKIIEMAFDPLTSFIFIDRIKGYGACETKIRYEEASGKTITRHKIGMIFKRKNAKLVRLLKDKGVI